MEDRIQKLKNLKNETNITNIASIMQILEDENIGVLAKDVFETLNCDIKKTPELLELSDTLKDISNYSIKDGYKGFIYNDDTADFFDRNKEMILRLVDNEAVKLGDYDGIGLINSFESLNGKEVITEDIHDICKFKGVSQNNDLHTRLKTALTWFAGEKVAHTFTDNIENKEIDKKYLDSAKNKLDNYVNNAINRIKQENTKQTSKENAMSM